MAWKDLHSEILEEFGSFEVTELDAEPWSALKKQHRREYDRERYANFRRQVQRAKEALASPRWPEASPEAHAWVVSVLRKAEKRAAQLRDSNRKQYLTATPEKRAKILARQRVLDRKYREDPVKRAHRAELRKAWAEAHKEHLRSRHREWRARRNARETPEEREARLRRKRELDEKSKAARAATTRAWKERNRERHLESHREESARRRARETPEQREARLQKKREYNARRKAARDQLALTTPTTLTK
jgi:hypothetical protein